MFDGLLTADHTVPVGTITLKPKACENCRRPFLRRDDSKVKHCVPCRSMYGAWADQLWVCRVCLTERAWGEGHPENTEPKQLRCSHCSGVQEHLFVKLTSPRA